MTASEIQQLQRAQPFRLHLADGRALDVEHPEFLASRGGRTVVVYTDEDKFEIVDVRLVVSLEVLDGKPKRRKRSSR
jgi:hypothetical protein